MRFPICPRPHGSGTAAQRFLFGSEAVMLNPELEVLPSRCGLQTKASPGAGPCPRAATASWGESPSLLQASKPLVFSGPRRLGCRASPLGSSLLVLTQTALCRERGQETCCGDRCLGWSGVLVTEHLLSEKEELLLSSSAHLPLPLAG